MTRLLMKNKPFDPYQRLRKGKGVEERGRKKLVYMDNYVPACLVDRWSSNVSAFAKISPQ